MGKGGREQHVTRLHVERVDLAQSLQVSQLLLRGHEALV
jgi:hypothetical protein